MQINQLRAFVTTARLGNITRTAEALHLTQPAITAQIKALEEELGVALFDRRPGRVSLTRAGEVLLVEAEQVLSSASQLMGKARQLQGELSGVLQLGTVGDTETLRLGALLGELVSSLPLLEIKTRHGHAEDLREQVSAGLLGGSFYIGPHIPRDVLGLSLQTLYYRVVAPLGYREKLLYAGWQDVAAMPWIGAPQAHHIHTLLHAMFSRQGLLPNVVLETDEAANPMALLRAGLGLAIMREDQAIKLAEKGELAIWPHTRVVALLSFIYPKSEEFNPAIVATLSQLRKVWGVV